MRTASQRRAGAGRPRGGEGGRHARRATPVRTRKGSRRLEGGGARAIHASARPHGRHGSAGPAQPLACRRADAAAADRPEADPARRAILPGRGAACQRRRAVPAPVGRTGPLQCIAAQRNPLIIPSGRGRSDAPCRKGLPQPSTPARCVPTRYNAAPAAFLAATPTRASGT